MQPHTPAVPPTPTLTPAAAAIAAVIPTTTVIMIAPPRLRLRDASCHAMPFPSPDSAIAKLPSRAPEDGLVVKQTIVRVFRVIEL